MTEAESSPADGSDAVTTKDYRGDFPVLAADPDLHFLDSGASSQKPESVLEAMDEFARTTYANVHRGAYQLSVASTEAYEATRTRVARFIGAPDDQQVILNRGATTGLNQVALGWGMANLGQDDRIVSTVAEHHANLVPWQQVAAMTGARLDHVPLNADQRLDLDAYEAMMDDDVAVVSITGMSNVLGISPPLDRISAAARAADAMVVVDGAQLVPHHSVDVSALDIDALAFSSHKMLGPTGIGALWASQRLLEKMEPIEFGGDMIADVQLGRSTWAPIPHRFEAGTPPIIEAVGLTAAIEYLETVGMETVAAHDRDLTEYALERLTGIDGLEIQGPKEGPDRAGVISFTVGDIHAHDLATILDEGGVAVRAGHHCAKPLMAELGVVATARASFHIYNNREDADALVDGIKRAIELF
ncbi:MAG: SufS family cysteine desulfurase, partial [Acidimicrobiia bacterium]|nr:SufS family cysteine desulfurase [Acidimicrobiia bacterium]